MLEEQLYWVPPVGWHCDPGGAHCPSAVQHWLPGVQGVLATQVATSPFCLHFS